MEGATTKGVGCRDNVLAEEQMTAFTNETPLSHPLLLKPGHSSEIIRTIGDAARFIVKLPKENEKSLHWMLAGACLEAVDRHPEDPSLLDTATMSVENALVTDKMLRK